MFLGLREFVNEYLLESKRGTTYLDEFSQAWKNHWQGPGAQPHFGLMFLGLREFVNEYLLESKRGTTYLDEFSQAWKNHWQGPGAKSLILV